MSAERSAWDRRDGETTRAYAAFRQYRDLGPNRRVEDMSSVSRVTAERWSARWDWVARATAWDDAQHMIEDAERLEALRAMHRTHQIAGRAALSIALRALNRLDPDDLDASQIARLLQLGAQLERETLTTSVAELQGRTPIVEDDPFDVIARELSGS